MRRLASAPTSRVSRPRAATRSICVTRSSSSRNAPSKSLMPRRAKLASRPSSANSIVSSSSPRLSRPRISCVSPSRSRISSRDWPVDSSASPSLTYSSRASPNARARLSSPASRSEMAMTRCAPTANAAVPAANRPPATANDRPKDSVRASACLMPESNCRVSASTYARMVPMRPTGTRGPPQDQGGSRKNSSWSSRLASSRSGAARLSAARRLRSRIRSHPGHAHGASDWGITGRGDVLTCSAFARASRRLMPLSPPWSVEQRHAHACHRSAGHARTSRSATPLRSLISKSAALAVTSRPSATPT